MPQFFCCITFFDTIILQKIWYRFSSYTSMDISEKRYKPGPYFEEDAKAPLLDISLTESKELWLIQWPFNQLQAADFHGKELSLKLHGDGQLGSFDSSTGKSYEVVSFAAQEPNATVFVSSESESKVVGKISRRICLVHYPEPKELEKAGFASLNLSAQRSEGSSRKSMYPRSLTPSKNRSLLETDGIFHDSIGQRSQGSSNRQKKCEANTSRSELSGKSSEQFYHASDMDTQIIYTQSETEPSHSEKLKKKKKKMKKKKKEDQG
ncbi:uncharacterized protein [Typha latifolia]|uniref:uncharacterized protein isoform X1 n=2 Tax=Typha latifolia TaxID=4733 RepID=UPI003C303F29